MSHSMQEVPDLDFLEDSSMYDITLPEILGESPNTYTEQPNIKIEDSYNFYQSAGSSSSNLHMMPGEYNAYSPVLQDMASPSMPYTPPNTYAASRAYSQSPTYTPLQSPSQHYQTNEDYIRYGLNQSFQTRMPHSIDYSYYYGDYSAGKRKKRDDELTQEEFEKRRLRRERNKQAALRCRTRRRERIDALEQETAEIEQDNFKVESEISKLKKQVNDMQLLLKDHKCDKNIRTKSCPEVPVTSTQVAVKQEQF